MRTNCFTQQQGWDPGIPGNFPKKSFPVRSREFFRFPGKFREIFIYYQVKNSSISLILGFFLIAQNQNLLSKKMILKISNLKIIEIRQRNAFSIKNGMFLIYHIGNLNFPGIPGKFPEYFGNSHSREIEIVREIPNPN